VINADYRVIQLRHDDVSYASLLIGSKFAFLEGISEKIGFARIRRFAAASSPDPKNWAGGVLPPIISLHELSNEGQNAKFEAAVEKIVSSRSFGRKWKYGKGDQKCS